MEKSSSAQERARTREIKLYPHGEGRMEVCLLVHWERRNEVEVKVERQPESLGMLDLRDGKWHPDNRLVSAINKQKGKDKQGDESADGPWDSKEDALSDLSRLF